MVGLKGLWNSKKAWMSCVGSVIMFICMYFGLTVEQTLVVAGPVMGYVLGQSGVDIAAMVRKVKEGQ